MARVDPYTICLVGRWQSNTIILYLHTTENSFTKGLLVKMFEHSATALIPPNHSGNWCHMALKGPQGPFSKRFLEAWYRISVVLAT